MTQLVILLLMIKPVVNENVVEVVPHEGKLSSVWHLGALVQQHLSRLQDDLPPLEVEVDQGQGPVLDDILMAGISNLAY